MNNALKRELSILTGLFALLGAAKLGRTQTALLAGTALGLNLLSRIGNWDFRGKTAFITGGSRGLGLSLAWNLLERGAAVALIARDKDELERAKKILLRDYPQANVYLGVCDITDRGLLVRCFTQAAAALGGFDLVVNNAGSILVGPFAAMQKEDFEAQMKLHLFAAIDLIQIASHHFRSRGGGRILNICSLGGKVGVPHMSPYDASKFALAGFAQGVHAELARENIIATTAFPTVMRTGSPIQAVFKGDHEKEFKVFETLDTLPGLSMSADRAAKLILNAVAEGKSEVVLSVPAQLRVAFGAFLPETMNALMGLAVRFLPNDSTHERKTGADSTARKERRREEVMYNQRPQHDADFNLGIKN